MTVACDIIIDDQFRRLIPPPTADELEQLEANLVADGCRDPLVVWSGHGILLDGHNRLEICTRRGIAYNVAEVELEDREAAENWIDTNQLGRRNLSPGGASVLRGRIYNRKKKAEGGRADRDFSGDHFEHPKTSELLSDKLGVSPATIRRDGQFAEAVDALREVAPELEREIFAGDAPARKDVIAAAKIVETEPEEATRILTSPRVVLHSSASNEWYTPAAYVDAARELLGGIDLDPASCEFANRVIKAQKFFTESENGLEFDWFGRVWLNPPYGKSEDGSNQEIWSRYLIEQYRAGNCTEAVLLVTAAPGNKWFSPLWDFPICFPDHRIRFYDVNERASQPTHSNALVYIGKNLERFHSIFSKFGVVAVKYDGV